ncbi:DUF58 domain-containing protein [Candidatus Nanohalovita haloferacivicina]|uniref:DUF58 domain-containing protein n=1 Tax=Candidatus Nanohalovita haloferacivicina TaxID=2978046 RepID=UPI00325FA30B|nr:DUF58 family protein [Candidatus Nanohalobia archaeon BNXNv]
MKEEDFFGSDDLTARVDTEVKRVAELFRFALKYKEQFQASGIEFSDLREYQVTDDASRIDWKNSASTDALFVKEYEEEKDMDVYIILDVSDSMMFGTADKMKSEYAAVVAAALTYASIDAGINAGFGMYGDDQITINPDGGQDQYQKVLLEVTKFSNHGGTFNLEEALNDTIGQIKANTALFIVSDFIEAKGDWKAKMKIASEKFRHVMCIMTRDLRDYKLPEGGNMRFKSPAGSQQMTVNTDKIREKYNEKARNEEKALKSKMEGAGAGVIKVDTREQFSGAFAEYMDETGSDW